VSELHWSRFETDRSPKGHGLRARHRNRTWIAFQDASGRWRVAPTDRPQDGRDFKTWDEARGWAQKHASANPAPQPVHTRPSRRRNREVTVEKTVVELDQHVELVDGETGQIEWEGSLEDFLAEGLRTAKLRMDPDDVIERFARRGYVDFGSSAFAPIATLREANLTKRNTSMAKRRSNPGRQHVSCGDLSDKDCRQLQHVYESARARGFTKQRAAQQAWGSLDNPGRPKRRRRNGARGRKKNGAGLGAFLGSLVGSALGFGVASVPLAILGSIGGGALGGHLGAPKDRRKRGSVGGAVGAAILGPIGAAAGGYIAGREPDRSDNPTRRRRNAKAQAGRIYTVWKHGTNKRWFVADGVSPAATSPKGYGTKAEAVRSAEDLIDRRGVAARIAIEPVAANPKTRSTALARRR